MPLAALLVVALAPNGPGTAAADTAPGSAAGPAAATAAVGTASPSTAPAATTAAMVGAAPPPQPGDPVDAVWLPTAELMETVQDSTCANDVPRYSMVAQPVPVEAGLARSGYGVSMAASCPTLFTFTANVSLALAGPATATIWLQCDLPTPGFSLGARLTPTGIAATSASDPLDDGWVYAPGPTACLAEPSEVVLEGIPTHNMSLEPGEQVALAVTAYYTSPPPTTGGNLHYVVGGDAPSRLDVKVRMPAPETLPVGRLHWSDRAASASWEGPVAGLVDPCVPVDELPHVALNLTVPPEGRIDAPVGSPPGSCAVVLAYRHPGPMQLRGTAHVAFWYACDVPTAGNDALFQVGLHADGEPITRNVQTRLPSPGVCGDKPTPVTVDVPLERAVDVGANATLQLTVAAFYVNGPVSLASNLHYLVGPEYGGVLELEGLPVLPGAHGTAVPPSAGATTPAGAPTPGPSALPALGMALAAAVAMRRQRR